MYVYVYTKYVYGYRNAMIFFEFAYCLVSIALLVNFFRPFMFFPSAQKFVDRDSQWSTYYLVPELIILASAFFSRLLFIIGASIVSDCNRGCFEYLA